MTEHQINWTEEDLSDWETFAEAARRFYDHIADPQMKAQFRTSYAEFFSENSLATRPKTG